MHITNFDGKCLISAAVGMRVLLEGGEFEVVEKGLSTIRLLKVYRGALCKPTKANIRVLRSDSSSGGFTDRQFDGTLTVLNVTKTFAVAEVSDSSVRVVARDGTSFAGRPLHPMVVGSLFEAEVDSRLLTIPAALSSHGVAEALDVSVNLLPESEMAMFVGISNGGSR